MQKTYTMPLATANTNLDGTGTIVSVVTAPPGGCTIVQRAAIARVTTTAGRVSWFIKRQDVWTLDAVMPVDARTVGATVPPFQCSESCSVPLQEGDQYGAAPYASEAMSAKVVTEAA